MKRYINRSVKCSRAYGWTDAYEEFNKIVDKFWDWNDPDSEEIVEREVDRLYFKHKGDPSWDEAYTRWSETRENRDDR